MRTCVVCHCCASAALTFTGGPASAQLVAVTIACLGDSRPDSRHPEAASAAPPPFPSYIFFPRAASRKCTTPVCGLIMTTCSLALLRRRQFGSFSCTFLTVRLALLRVHLTLRTSLPQAFGKEGREWRLFPSRRTRPLASSHGGRGLSPFLDVHASIHAVAEKYEVQPFRLRGITWQDSPTRGIPDIENTISHTDTTYARTRQRSSLWTDHT